ncbi:MAG: carboxypeptidase-like regulatory domain-containing protein [Acidobacteria bacterium]|nr:carboxypeptidase-like regulatory domain-containing protein [Acidobacteriota bacterium]
MKISARFSRMAAVVGILLLVVTQGTVSAQTTLGRLAGTVMDASGGVLPGATVTMTNTQTNQAQTTVTGATGAFLFPQLQASTYKVVIELQGFKTATYPSTAINVNQESSLTARLEIGGLSETVIVEGTSQQVQTTTPEITRTVLQQQLLQLPVVNRDMTNLIRMQAGVPGVVARVNTGINGGRATWTQVTQDGINVQDNFIRTNSLDFLPNRPTSDNVAEFTITSSVAGADSAGGATSIRMVTPSGTNQFRGSAFEQNRDNRFAANSFFNNKSAVPKPILKQNQFGGSVGGPILKNKMFFFGFYEGFKRQQAGAQNVTIPAYADTFQGVWRYLGLDGQVHAVNILQAVGLSIDQKMQSTILSKIPDASHVNNYDRGDSKAGAVLNTAGYRWNQNRLTNRNYFGGRVDYELNQNHHVELIGSYFHETDDRPDLDFISQDRPLAFTDSPVKRFVGSWRWMVSSKFQNEMRAGGNLAPVKFEVTASAIPTLRFAGQTGTLPLTLQDPEINFLPQGRYTNTYQFNDNASLTLGTHALQMGMSYQRIHVNPYNYEASVPTIAWGFSSTAPASVQLTNNMFPGGISSANLSSANTMLSLLSGTISGVSRTFQVQDQSSGYVAGIPNNRNYTLNNIAAYLQDSWRWKSNFTVRAGLKWEYYSPVKEDNNLGFLPVLNGRSYEEVLRDPNATVSFVNGGMWNPNKANFGPTIGFAWDVFKDGRTSVRGGYSLTYVNEEGVTVATAALGNNAGLASGANLSNLYTTLNAGVPEIPTPAFKTVRTLADQMALSATGSMGMVDPNIKQPKVHQVSIGVSRELRWGVAAEARYIGTFGRGIWKGIDMNQVQVSPAFADDFQRARNNGYLALAANGIFDPTYNSAVAGSATLTVLPTYGVSLLGGSSARTFIQQNEVAGLADFYVTSRVAGALATIYQNGGIYQAAVTKNDGWQNYNALQVELRRQYRNGFMAQVNYTFSHTTANSTGGTSQSRFEPYLDNARPQLDAGRSAYNITHLVNANLIFDLPFGEGRKWLNRGGLLNEIVGGWQVSSVIHWQSGSPVGIYSTRGTFNRANRSGANTANSTLSLAEIAKLFKLTSLPDGRIFWIDPTLVGPDGRAVGADNLANTGFSGQVFFNPTAGQVGSLPILAFDAPAIWTIDASLAKKFKIVGRYNLEFRAEAFNLTNSVSFYAGDFNINSTTFGRITGTGNGSRIVQFTLRFSF